MASNEELRVRERKTPDKRRAKAPALLRNPLHDEHSSPAKLAVWTGRLPAEGHDAVNTSHIRPQAPLPTREQLEDRAKRIQHKIASWDREKLEAYYTRTLLSAQLLRKSQRILGEVLPVLTAMAEQRASYQELRKTARILALYANMLLKPELARRRGFSKGGVKGSAENHGTAVQRHNRWYAAYCRFLAGGGDPRRAASTLAEQYGVTPRTFRDGLKEASARAERAGNE